MIHTFRYLFVRFLLTLSVGVGIVCIPFIAETSAYAAQTQTSETHTTQSQAKALHSHAQAGAGHATIIILDMSGSMVISDPHGYRCSAANAYIDLSGAGDYIGLVGLDNNNGQTTGDHNFQAAQTWTQPQSTATTQDKDALKQSIVKNTTYNSQYCAPDAYTPTYDSLNIAYQMLDTVTGSKQVSGSVILLTDGVPCLRVDDQVTAIQNELVPKFRNKGWPIDTVGLGADAPISSSSTSGCPTPGTLPGTFHGFLSNVSNGTGGNFYDDSNGPVSGVSALNLAPFFAQIFAKYSGETLHKDIPPTQEMQDQNFSVVSGTNELDVLVVRDSPNVQVALLNPQSQPIDANVAGVLYSSDNYNVIYRVPNPGPGPWILRTSGAGQYLMDDFQQTDVGLVINSVQLQGSSFADPQPLPLNDPIVVNAQVTTGGQLLNNSDYTLSGYISFNGSSDDCAQAPTRSLIQFDLTNNGNGYTGTFTVPANNAAGTYDILLCASTGSAQNVFASLNKPIRLELFPAPFLISPATNQPTDQPIATTVTRWPSLLSWSYSLPWTSWLSGWALQGTPAQAQTSVQVEMQWKGQAYPNATVQSPATVSYTDTHGTQKTLQATVSSQGQGNFLVQFPPDANGDYSIAFQTGGNYSDSHGEFGPPVTRMVNVTIQNAPINWVEQAYAISLFYLVVLAFLILLIRFWLTPRPQGEWIRNPGTDASTKRSFGRSRRDPITWFFQRNVLRSAQTGMPAGLRFRFGWGGRIEVQPEDTSKGKNWKTYSHGPLQARYQQAQQLIYVTKADGNEETADRYLLNAGSNRAQRSTASSYRGGISSYRSRTPSRSSGNRRR